MGKENEIRGEDRIAGELDCLDNFTVPAKEARSRPVLVGLRHKYTIAA
ncbi:MAG: hypothetical protein JXP73_15640 [Deltaproteobacteria bacterium]|jgi:hypothetical protein|nr:hypothetical protein [Deltaproteobacteria bacterium]